MRARAKFTALQAAYIAVCAATLTAGKAALAAIPNVEVVSLLLGVYGYVFGLAGVLSSLVFCAVEVLIWGAGSWVVLYFIYWPLFTLLFALLSKAKIKSRLIPLLCALTMTAFFGVLSSLIDTGLFTGFHENFWNRFAVLYVRGGAFYLTQIVCNAVAFTLLFSPLCALLRRIAPAKLTRFKRKKPQAGAEKMRENTLNCHIIK